MKAPERTLSERMRKHADKTEMRCPRWYPKSLRSAWREAWNASRDLMRAWADEVSALEQEIADRPATTRPRKPDPDWMAGREQA